MLNFRITRKQIQLGPDHKRLDHPHMKLTFEVYGPDFLINAMLRRLLKILPVPEEPDKLN